MRVLSYFKQTNNLLEFTEWGIPVVPSKFNEKTVYIRRNPGYLLVCEPLPEFRSLAAYLISPHLSLEQLAESRDVLKFRAHNLNKLKACSGSTGGNKELKRFEEIYLAFRTRLTDQNP